MPYCSLMKMGSPSFNAKLTFSYDKYSVDKAWTKIYCHFNFRGITLCLQVSASILLCDNLPEKYGFRPNSRRTDSLFILQQLLNKYTKQHKKHNADFIDYEKAFESAWQSG